MAGDFSEIYNCDIPATASPGEQVTILVDLRNTGPMKIFFALWGWATPAPGPMEVYPDCAISLTEINPDCPLIEPGWTPRYVLTFIMPDHDVDITIRSSYWGGDMWYWEEEIMDSILVEAAPAEFSSFQVAQYI